MPMIRRTSNDCGGTGGSGLLVFGPATAVSNGAKLTFVYDRKGSTPGVDRHRQKLGTGGGREFERNDARIESNSKVFGLSPTDLVRWSLVWLFEKLAYRQIDQGGPAIERSVATRRHDEQLRVRQSAKYLGVFLNRCEVVITRHH